MASSACLRRGSGRLRTLSVRNVRNLAFAAILAAAPAWPQDTPLSFSVGLEQASGDYGGNVDLADTYLPLTLRYETNRMSFRVTVPFLDVEFADPSGTETWSENGIGDVVLGLTVYDVIRSRDRNVAVDVTTKVKMGTADERKGLGTGETDYSLQADVYRFLRDGSLVASIGYRFRGAPSDVVLEDTWILYFGGFRRLAPRLTGGLLFDYRESSIPAFESIRSLTTTLSHRLDHGWYVQGYLAKGFSDSTPDWGAGFSMTRDF